MAAAVRGAGAGRAAGVASVWLWVAGAAEDGGVIAGRVATGGVAPREDWAGVVGAVVRGEGEGFAGGVRGAAAGAV